MPKLLKAKIDPTQKQDQKGRENAILQRKRIVKMAEDICWGLVDYQKNNRNFSQYKDKFTLKSH